VLSLAALAGVLMFVLQLQPLPWLIGILVLWRTGTWLYHRWQAHRIEKLRGRELPEPFAAEVVLDGRTVATISDRIVTEMFWRDYRIEAVDETGRAAIANDELWETGRFTFREPGSGMVSTHAFAGGGRPFVRDSRVSIRGLYFKKRANI
jgi:hypothetical protein